MGATRPPWTPTPHIRSRLAFPTAPPSAHLCYPTASFVSALSSIQITIQIIWRARPRQRTGRTSRLLTPLRSVGWERADRPWWAGDAAGVRVRCLSNSPGSTAPFFSSTSQSRPRSSSRLLVRCWRVCKYTRRVSMRVLATHIKHAMARMIEWAALSALLFVPVHPRVGHCAPAPAGPSRTERAPLYTSRFWPSVTPREPCLHVHPSLALVQTLPSRRGVLRATGRCAK
ncbi:hypothetical protein K438DRAFT_958790 [Mycena galopus ATCC 62051]|nr:hypothetical protein K438DRAFT_958790 [Mycena galopus ATCC 62051]